MVSYLNEVLSSPDGRIYFLDDSKASSFKPVEVANVATWAREFANLLEPSSLGRPHFAKYLDKVRMSAIPIDLTVVTATARHDH